MVTRENMWDVDVLDDVFETRDVELIQRIPIQITDKIDSWYWLFDEKGEFTVRSCYRGLQGECQSPFKMFWKQLWTLKLPCNVINFLWHVCKGSLPTNQALALKHVNVPGRCTWSHGETKSDVHVLFLCDFANIVWLNAGLAHVIQVLPYDTTFLAILRAFESCTRKERVQICMLC